MKKPAKKQTTKKRSTKRKPVTARPYVMPKTAAELNILCAECSAPAEWFDYERAAQDHKRGFICSAHPRSAKSEKLLTNAATIAA